MNHFIIFGMGKIGKAYVEECIAYGIKNIILSDFNPNLWGTSCCGFEIQSPDAAMAGAHGLIIISTGEQYFGEIRKKLTGTYNVADSAIVPYSETVKLSKDEIYNLGNLQLKEPLRESTIVSGRSFYELLENDRLNELEMFFFTKKHNPMSKWLHYFEAYDRHFSKFRGRDLTILEIGVFQGASLQMWKNYFRSNGNQVRVYGIDINPMCKYLEEDHIKLLIGSQEDRNFLRQVKEQIGTVDILIDDGGHTMKQQITTIEELFDMVDDEGIYLCEDLHTSYMKKYGGGYKGDTFIEYSKQLIDALHHQYMEIDSMDHNPYTGKIKSVNYYDSMIFIEKMKRTTKSLSAVVKL